MSSPRFGVAGRAPLLAGAPSGGAPSSAGASLSIAPIHARRPYEKPPRRGGFDQKAGGDLLSQAVAHQVPSALRGLTALFGMGRGVSPSLWPPKSCGTDRPRRGLKTARGPTRVKITVKPSTH